MHPQSQSLIPGFLSAVKQGDIFVETGTADGGGIWAAFDAGFRVIHSIDDATHRPDDLPRWTPLGEGEGVFLHHGDSALTLRALLQRLSGPATFFLDAHTLGRESPLADELRALRNYPHPHTIIIDDLRYYIDGSWQPPLSVIVMLLERRYNISFAPNKARWDDLLIAKLK